MSHDVSIILSTYLSDNYIEKYYYNCIKLIENINIQLVHILNDPTPKELEYKKKFFNLEAKKGKKNFQYKFLIVKRESLYASWNRAINLSESKFISISNIDDIRYPLGLKSQISRIREYNEMVLLGSYFNVKTEDNLIIHDNTKNQKINRNDFFAGMYIGPFFMWSNPIFFKKKQIYFDEQFHVAGDFDFQIRFASVGKVEILSENVGQYLNNVSGLSTGSILQSIEGQVIYYRYNVVDKKLPLFSFLFFEKYEPFLIKINSEKLPLNKVCSNLSIINRTNKKRKKNPIDYLNNIVTVIKMIIKKFILKRK